MTSATEELRRLLDERGMKWRAWDGVHPITVWHDEWFSYEYMERTLLNGVKPHTGEVVDGSGRLEAVIHVCTPEQAVAATLGPRTCHNASKVMDEHGQARFACSECGAWIDLRMLWNPEYRNGESPWINDCKLNYCPNCGSKVVS